MPKYKMLVFSDPTKGGSEENYNKWYNEQHIPDVCRIDGFTGAQRFKNSVDGITQYLAIYEVDAPDANAAMENLASKAGTDEMVMSDDIDIETTKVMIYEVLTEPYTP